MQNLVRVEGMSLEAMRAGINWEFESFDDYLALIERQGVGPNIAAFVGHSSVRTYVMGSDAPLRSATVDEAERVDPLDFMFDLALSEELETTLLSVLLNSDESAVARLLTHEYSTVALSDAGAHLTFFLRRRLWASSDGTLGAGSSNYALDRSDSTRDFPSCRDLRYSRPWPH